MYLCPEGGNNVKFTVTLPDNTVDEYEPTVSANNSYIFCPFYEVYTTPEHTSSPFPKAHSNMSTATAKNTTPTASNSPTT